MFVRAEPRSHQHVKAERLSQQLQRSTQSNVGFVFVFRQAAPLLLGRALPKLLMGRIVHHGSLLAGLRDPEPLARPPGQPARIEVRHASNEQIIVQGIKGGALEQPGSFVVAGLHRAANGW